MRIVIAAEPLENGAGLSVFLLDSVALFARARPDWQFTLLVLSAFSDAKRLEKYPNIKIVFCDRLGWRGALSKRLPKLPGQETVCNILAEKLPAKGLRKQFGGLAEVWDDLGQYDAVWVPHFAVNRNHWPALYRPGTIKAPVLLSIFDLHPAVFPEEYEQHPEVLTNFRNGFKTFAQSSSAIITHSQFQKTGIIGHFGIDPDKIKVVYMPLPDDEALSRSYGKREISAVCQKFGVNEPYMFCPMSQGAIHKNHIRLIRAWAKVNRELGDKCPQLVFTSRGSPSQFNTFFKLVKKLGLDRIVIFTGPIDRDQMAVLYQNCAAVVSPTLYESGCGLPILEAFSVGKNIAASDIPPVKEQADIFKIPINYFDPLDENDIAKCLIKTAKESRGMYSPGIAQTDIVKKTSRQQFLEGYIEKLEAVAHFDQNRLKPTENKELCRKTGGGDQTKLKIIIAAEPLVNGAGLSMFLLDSVALFAQARPDWQFTLLVLSAFSDAVFLKQYPNVKVLYCDRLGWRGTLSHLLPAFRGRERIFNLLAEKAPIRFLRKQFGDLSQVWENLGHYDAVWVPHFAISQNRWPALYQQGTIKSPVLLTIHDLHTAAFPEESEPYPEITSNFWKAFCPFAQKAEAVITHSNFQKEAIVKHFHIQPRKISVAYLPLPVNELLARNYTQREIQDVLKELGIARPFVFSPISQISKHKNHLRAIEAWAIVKSRLGDKTPQLVFTVKGHPKDQERFRREIEKRDLQGQVIFTGKVSREKLAILYRACQALLSPTIYEGGGSGPVMEAVMAGRPVLCSRIPPIEEQMGRFGLSAAYFDPYKPEDMARAVLDMVSSKEPAPQNNQEAIMLQLPKDREALARAYLDSFLRITENK